MLEDNASTAVRVQPWSLLEELANCSSRIFKTYIVRVRIWDTRKPPLGEKNRVFISGKKSGKLMAGGVKVSPIMADPGAAAAAKVRVVRCPKCGKLLPELEGFNVYRCGGCNATLRANQQAQTKGCPSEKSAVGLSETSENIPSVSYVGGKTNTAHNTCPDVHRAEQSHVEGIAGSLESVNGSIYRRPASGECVVVRNGHNITNHEVPRENGQVDDRESVYNRRPSKAPLGDQCSNGGEMERFPSEETIGNKEAKSYGPDAAHANGFGANLRFPNTPRNSSQDIFSPLPGETVSNSQARSLHQNHKVGEVVQSHKPETTGRQNVEQDHMELLRKLDELREQLSQSCKVGDRMNPRAPNNYQECHPQDINGHSSWLHEGPSINRRVAPCSSLPNRHGFDVQNHHHTLNAHNDTLRYGVPLASQPVRGGHYNSLHPYPLRTSPSMTHGHLDQDYHAPFHHDALYRQSDCSCSHHCNRRWQMPSQLLPSGLASRCDPFPTNSLGFYPVGNTGSLIPGNFNQSANGSILSQHAGDHHQPAFRNMYGRQCQPLAGGSPFVVCYYCSELLQVPPNLLLMDKDWHKLRCASCSEVITFQVNRKGNVITASDLDGNTSGITNKDDRLRLERMQHEVGQHQAIINSCLEDCGYPNYNSLSTNEKFILPSYPPRSNDTSVLSGNENRTNFTEPEKLEVLSSSSSASKEDRSPDAMLFQREISRSAELVQRPEPNGRIPGLPLREHFGYPPSNLTSNRSGIGSRSARSESDKLTCINGGFKQNSMKDVSVATEMDFQVDDYPGPGFSEDSDEASKEDDVPRISKGGDSFFTGLIRKRFSRSNQQFERTKCKVVINGHPIPDRTVKKAEKQAGPIQPGDYWYDYRAGFWGVMGQHCLGIIPPFIEEFNYPMPRKCAGGNTGVIVNGRELNQKDMELLAGRGLPTSQDRSYVIEISGKVFDAVSGEELDCLGKLAPTVEKMKHGFGMRVM